MRKIVQIAASQVEYSQRWQCDTVLFALCNDGTVWFLRDGDGIWYPSQPIPIDKAEGKE